MSVLLSSIRLGGRGSLGVGWGGGGLLPILVGVAEIDCFFYILFVERFNVDIKKRTTKTKNTHTHKNTHEGFRGHKVHDR